MNNVFPNQEIQQISVNDSKFNNILLSTDKSLFPHHVEPTLAIGSNSIFAGFKNAETPEGSGLAVSYTYSTDGKNWAVPYNMEQFWEDSGQSDPWMQVFDNTLYYVYLEYTYTGDTQMTLAKTSDQGSNWQLVSASHGSGFADKETFAIDENGYIYLAYDDQLANNVEIKLSRSFDGGDTFIENVTISDGFSEGYLGPYIVSAGSGVLVNAFIFLGNSSLTSDIFIDKSIDYGETWGLDTDLNPNYNASQFSQGPTGRASKVTLPSMTIDLNGRIYIVWEDVSTDIENDNWDVYMRYSDDMAETWSDRIRINENIEGNSWMPDLDVDSYGNVHIIYYDDITGFSNLMYRIYYPANNSLSNEYKISTEGTSSVFTRLGDYVTVRVDNDDNVHMVWTDGRNDVMDIYYATNKVDVSAVTSSSNSLLSSNIDSKSKKSQNPLILDLGLSLIIVVILIKRMKH